MADFRKFSDKIPFRVRSETAEIAIELSMQPWEAFRPDGVIMFSDILTPLPALGIEFDVIKGKGPVISAPIRSMEAVQNMRPMADPDKDLPFIREILSTLRSNVGDQSTVLGFVGTPWTLAAYAIEGKADRHCIQTKQMMLKNPEILRAMLDNLTDALIVYVCHQIDSGAQVVQLFDSWAHHLSPAQFREFSLPYAQRIIAEVKVVHPNTPLIFHANGGTGKLESLGGCTADVVGLDWAVDLQDARRTLPGRVTQGNMDPMVLFGGEAAIRQAVEETIRKTGGKRHILNVGHGVVQGTPEENVKFFCQLAHESGTPATGAKEPALVA